MSKITITRGATVNLGNYESARVDLSVEFENSAQLADHDEWLKLWLLKQVEAIQTEAGLPPKAAERFTGGTGE